MIDRLEEVERRGYSRYEVFTDWFDLMLHSLQRDDEAYHNVLEKYDSDCPRGENAPDLYSEAFGALQQGMAETDADLLGVIYEELGMDSDSFGQYFTPHNVCEMKAEMVGSVDDTSEESITVADPACGSGRLLIYAARKLPDELDVVFYGQDKDTMCAKMTALNMCFYNMDGYAVQGDSLKVEQNRMWETQGSVFGGSVKELREDEFVAVYSEEDGENTDSGDESGESTVVELEDTTLSDFANTDKKTRDDGGSSELG